MHIILCGKQKRAPPNKNGKAQGARKAFEFEKCVRKMAKSSRIVWPAAMRVCVYKWNSERVLAK